MIPDPGTRFTYTTGARPCTRPSRFATARLKMKVRAYIEEKYGDAIRAERRRVIDQLMFSGSGTPVELVGLRPGKAGGIDLTSLTVRYRCLLRDGPHAGPINLTEAVHDLYLPIEQTEIGVRDEGDTFTLIPTARYRRRPGRLSTFAGWDAVYDFVV